MSLCIGCYVVPFGFLLVVYLGGLVWYYAWMLEVVGDCSVSRSEVGSGSFSWFHRKLSGFNRYYIRLLYYWFWETFVFCFGILLYIFTCCFHEFSHQLSLTRFICLLV